MHGTKSKQTKWWRTFGSIDLKPKAFDDVCLLLEAEGRILHTIHLFNTIQCSNCALSKLIYQKLYFLRKNQHEKKFLRIISFYQLSWNFWKKNASGVCITESLTKTYLLHEPIFQRALVFINSWATSKIWIHFIQYGKIYLFSSEKLLITCMVRVFYKCWKALFQLERSVKPKIWT